MSITRGFHDLFLLMSSYYQRLQWNKKPKPIWYRQEQLIRDRCDRRFGHTPYDRMFMKFTKYPQQSQQCSRKLS